MANLNVRQRGKKWEYRFEAAVVDGKRKQISKGGFRTKAEAEAAGVKALAEYNNTGLNFQPTDISVADYLDYWFEKSVKVNLSYNTQLGYFGIIENHLKPAFGIYRLKSLQPSVLQDYFNGLKFKGYSKSSILGILTTFHSALEYARITCKFIAINPMADVKMPKIDKKPRERIVLSEEEWQQIITRFPEGNRFHVMLMIGYHTGMRIGEVCGLTWDDIDFENNTINICKQMVKRNFNTDVRKAYELTGKKEKRCAWYFQPTKTESSTDIITMGPTLKAVLQKEKARQAQNELMYGEFWTEHRLKSELDEKNNKIYRVIPVQKCVASTLPKARLICVDEDGSFTSSDSFKYVARVVKAELKLAFDFHALRHTHGTTLAESGVSPKAIQQRLRHANIETTFNTYIKATDKLKDEAVHAFEAARGQKIKGGQSVDNGQTYGS